jgi:hypothetical protein
MIRSLSLRTRCATASSRASGEPDAARLCVEREAVPDARDDVPPDARVERLWVALPPERVPREADELRADELRDEELRDVVPLDDPLAAARLVPPLREDELEAGFEPPLLELPLLEPLLLAWGTSPPYMGSRSVGTLPAGGMAMGHRNRQLCRAYAHRC